MAYLALHGVSKGYGRDPRAVLRDVDLAIDRGELVAIVGPSGAGKSTLLAILAGLLRPDLGTATLEGRPIAGPSPQRAVVFQNYALLPWLTVHQNVALAVDQVHPGWPRARRRARIDELLALVKLAAAHDKRPEQLSGGMRQRVSLARAMAMDPDVLLMDEPLSALDALTRGTLQDEIERLWAADRKTCVLVTNDIDEALRLADRLIPLTPGPVGPRARSATPGPRGAAPSATGATLGAPVVVDVPRPRDRRQLLHDRQYQQLRAHVIAGLAGARRRGSPASVGLREVAA